MKDTWRTSSYSGNGGQNCVEVGGDGEILIRDTKDNGHGPLLRVSPGAWKQFTTTIK
jgi:Domain of unknown function (DUF397)